MKDRRPNEQDIIEGFRHLPPIHDRRDAEEIYRKVMAGMEQEKAKKKRRVFLPSFAAAAALSFATVLGLYLAGGGHLHMPGKDAGKLEIYSESQDAPAQEESERGLLSREGADTANIQKGENVPKKSLLFSDDLGDGGQFVTLAIPDPQFQNMIPVTFLVKGGEGENWLQQYTEMMNEVHEEDLGLGEYYPYRGKLSFEEGDGGIRLMLSGEEAAQISSGTIGEEMLKKSFEVLRYLNLRKVTFYTDGKKGIFLPHTGWIEGYDIPQTPRYGYFLYKTENFTYLTPGPNAYSTVKEALKEMKKRIETHLLAPSIPEPYTVSAEDRGGGRLEVRFREAVTLPNDEAAMRMIEAILLTAKDFGYKEVLFQNVKNDAVGDYRLQEPLAVPLAPNIVAEMR